MYTPYEFKPQDAWDFARAVKIKAYERNGELHFKECPYCGGKSTDTKTFAISLKTGQFKCLREKCGAKGNMIRLAQDFDGFSLGNTADEYYKPKKVFKSFKKPEQPITPKDPALRYLQSRGIGEVVAKRYQITTHKSNDAILVIPFFDENGNLPFVKYRNTEYKKGDEGNKEWCQAGGKPILFGMQQCNLQNKTLILNEGQLDSMSCSQAGIENAVSVPTGAKGFTWVPYCWDWITNNFDTIIVFGDYENGHISLLDEIKNRFYMLRIKHVREDDYKDCKDANDLLKKYGEAHLRTCIENAIDIPMTQVIDLADVEDVNIYDLDKLETGISNLDDALNGGLPFGGVTIITGKSGKGKLLADDTPVFTKNGWKNHGDLIVGDEVIGRDGKFVKVTHVFPKDVANMCVEFNNNDVIYCHENHEWVTDLHHGNTYREEILTAKELFKRKESGYTHPLRLITREPLAGSEIKLHVKPYTLGVWLGDGRNRHPDICNPPKDYCIVQRIIDDGYEMGWHTVHKTTGVIYTSFKGLRKGLQKYGMCYSHRTVEKYIPFDYLVAPLKERLELLAGLLDTDGCYEPERNRYYYATTDIKLRDSFMDLIYTFGWNCCCYTQKAKTSSSGIKGKKDCYMIAFNPIGLDIPCVVERKRQCRISPKSNRRTTIRKIEYCEPKSGNCIEVEGGIYCVGRTMIPTHNSSFASQIVANALEQGYKCFAYSGELPNHLFRSWLYYQLAGKSHIQTYTTKKGKEGYKISETNKSLIKGWHKGKVFIYDSSNMEDENHSLLNLVEATIVRYGVKVVLIDNLMTGLDLEYSKETDKYERQSKFVKALARLGMRYDVLILLVAHKRKNSGNETDTMDEVSGSSDITNLGLVTLSYDTGSQKELKEGTVLATQRKLKLVKNRLFGTVNADGWVLDFEPKSKRIFGDGDDPDKEFGWTKNLSDGFDDIDNFDDLPWS